MKHGHGTFFLAVVLSTSAPVFADKTTLNFVQGDKDSASIPEGPRRNAFQDSSASRTFGLPTLKEDEFRIESNSAVIKSDFGMDCKISELDALSNSGLGPNDRLTSLYGLSSNRDGDDPLSVTAAPEPGSLTLLPFGLAGLGVLVFRRTALKNAIGGI